MTLGHRLSKRGKGLDFHSMPFIDIDFRSIRHSKEKREIVMKGTTEGYLYEPLEEKIS